MLRKPKNCNKKYQAAPYVARSPKPYATLTDIWMSSQEVEKASHPPGISTIENAKNHLTDALRWLVHA
jgi:hypothetical protein